MSDRDLHGDRAPGEVSDEPTLEANTESPAPLPAVSTDVIQKFELVLQRGVHTRTVVFTDQPTPGQIEAHRSAAEAEFDRIGEAPPTLQDRRKPR